VAIAPAATSAGDHKPPGGSDGAKLRKALTVKGMLRHEQALQRIAEANGGTRVSGTAGYDQSVDYVVEQLTKAGYKPVVQPFDFAYFQELTTPTFEQISPNPTTYVDQVDFATMDYSGSGNVTGTVQEVNDNQFPPGPTPSSSNAGCEPEDFTGFTAGNVALIQRGTCGFIDKAVNAEAAGATAAIIFNEGQPGRDDLLFGTLGAPEVSIPVIGVSFALGEEFHNTAGLTVHITTDTISEIRQTANVLADTRSGNPNRVVVQGSHLDSVVAGPGINDNGSGSSYNLESAIQVAKQHIKPKNKIRFAFWGAEESNLVGSTFYVDSLSDEDFAKILLNLNHDMIASPNYVRFVYDGDGSDTGTAGPPGSAEIEQVFNDYFDSQKLAHEATAFDGRSDYGPFIARGAPAGGLFSGAEGEKTQAQGDIFGGVVGEAYDRCYHQACDNMSNLNLLSFDELSDAAVTALAVFANWKGPIAAPATTLRAANVARQMDYAGNRLRQ
jgi:Zn-dependent M28 family amino/carboxypeptidase